MSVANYSHIPLGEYRHYKGNLYQLIEVAHHSETGEAMAVYRALYGERGLWVRPLLMFLETVQHNGKDLPRFQFVRPQTEQESSR